MLHSNSCGMPREAEPSLSERTFVLNTIEQGLRLDGRAFDQWRSLNLSFGDEHGVADVRLGKTRCVQSNRGSDQW